uniref:Lipoprotein n=1 Tax=uncultured Bacteroidota bacterium TaxID=152509 RepID=H5SK49_9BACT|nr:hypothetical protein HGMM_F40B03C23 [uncultured Bacteroidetes bacterium]
MRYASTLTRTGLLAALTATLFVACKKDKEQNGPSIVVPNETGVIAGDQTLTPGTHSLHFKLVFQKGSGKDDADLKDFSFTFNSGGGNTTVFANRPAPSGSTFTFDTTFEVTGTNGQVYTYTFTVRDKNDKTASKSFKITFQDTSSGSLVIDSLMNAGVTNQADGKGTYFRYRLGTYQLSTQDRTSAEGNPSEILFVYYFSSSSQRHSIISPAILRDSIYNTTPVEWDNPSTQTTTFRSVQASVSFDGITYQGIINAYNSGTDISNEFTGNGNQRAECTTGRLIAFKQGNIYGIVKVNSVSATGSASLSIKVARP